MKKKIFVSHLPNLFTPYRCLVLLLCSSILILALLLRIQGNDQFPAEQFVEIDGYFYYKQAQLISEHGVLPDRDMS